MPACVHRAVPLERRRGLAHCSFAALQKPQLTRPFRQCRDVAAASLGFEPLVAEKNEQEDGVPLRRLPGIEFHRRNGFRREARMVLKTLKLSLSVLAAATSVASLFAVSWIGLALLGY
jgi:hypothetical protein